MQIFEHFFQKNRYFSGINFTLSFQPSESQGSLIVNIVVLVTGAEAIRKAVVIVSNTIY